MRVERVGGLLLTLGLVVGAAAGIGLVLGFEPAQLPRELLNIAAYKLTFLAPGGLLAGGLWCFAMGDGKKLLGSASPPFENHPSSARAFPPNRK